MFHLGTGKHSVRDWRYQGPQGGQKDSVGLYEEYTSHPPYQGSHDQKRAGQG